MKKLLENRRINNQEKILVGGHRGCICQYEENTLQAMKEAIKCGADYLEIDLQLTKDGIIVVYHDTELSAKSTLKGYVHEYSLMELKEAMPWLNTFQEILQWASSEDVYLMLELKSVPFDMQQVNMLLVDQLIKDVLTYQMEQHVLAFGADYMVLKYLKSKCKAFQIGLIVPFVPANPVQMMVHMDALVYVSYIYNITQDIIDTLHEAGYFVDGAILRDERWITLARSLGVDMYESDYLPCSYI